MSILRDILDTREEIENLSLDDNPIKYNGRNSVAKEAEPGVLQFPVLVSSSLDLENVTMIAKALERDFVSFVIILTSIDAVTDERDIKSYLSRVHQNIGVEGSNTLGSIRDFKESFNIAPRDLKHMRLFLESQNSILGILENCESADGEKTYDPEEDEVEEYDDLNEHEKEAVKLKLAKEKECCNVSECYKYSGILKSIILKEDVDKYSQILIIRNGKTKKIKLIESRILPQSVFNESKAIERVNGISLSELAEYTPDFNMEILNKSTNELSNYAILGRSYLKDRLNGNKLNEESLPSAAMGGEFTPEPAVINVATRDSIVLKDILRDNDVKKANEMVPTLVHLKTYFKDKQGDLHPVDYMIGVKTVIHPIKSDSMCENIVSAMKRGKAFFNLMRLTTGEISFFKDFVFAINRTKDDVKTKYKDNPWWSALIRRRKYSRLLKNVNVKSQLVPNTSIVISMDEVDKIKAEHDIDLMNEKIVKDIMNQLFLISFVILDPSVEIAHILSDGQQYYQQYSFASLERENSNAQRDIKNVMQVLGRM